MSASPPRQVRLHRRLSVRLAVLIATTILVFDALRPWIIEGAYAALDVPHPDLEVYTLDSRWLYGSLLFDVDRSTPGRWQPDPAEADRFERASREDGLLYLWLAADGEVLTASWELPWAPGDHWDLPVEALFSVEVPGTGGLVVRAMTDDVYDGDQLAGRLIQLLINEEGHAATHEFGDEFLEPGECHFDMRDSIVFATQEEADRWREREERVHASLAAGVAVGTALLLALITSRLITRRISRLARLAGAPVAADGELPGPFDDRGGDEIAVLAKAMNARRERVGELMAGLAGQDERRRAWVAQVSHDLRTPLTALLACLDRCESVLSPDHLDEVRAGVREMVAVARLDADRVNALADDLLDIARLESDEALELEPVPSGELVRRTITALSPMAEVAGVALRGEVEPGLPVTEADGHRLARALENLLRNAIGHAEQHVAVHVSRSDDALRFEVRDDGPGLPEIDGQVDLSSLGRSRTRVDSAGLGLIVTRRVAEAHGGTLGGYNGDDGGAAVWFTIPLRAV